MLCVVHSISHAVGDNHVSGKFERLNVAFGLLKRTLHARAQALGFDDEVAVLRNPGQGPEDSYIDVPPLNCDTLRCPAERPQEWDDEVRNELVLASGLAEGLTILEKWHKIRRLGDDPLKMVGDSAERRLLGWQFGQRRRLPERWR